MTYGKSSFASILGRGLVVLNPSLAPGPLSWVFHSGMEFSDTAFWWGVLNTRPIPHEGVDFFSFLLADGSTGQLKESSRIPLAIPGKLIAITEDFLGTSLWFSHPDTHSETDILFSVYAHLKPAPNPVVGNVYPLNTFLGTPTLQNTPQTKTPAHLHVSTFFAPESLDIVTIDWSRLAEQTEVRFVDPLHS